MSGSFSLKVVMESMSQQMEMQSTWTSELLDQAVQGQQFMSPILVLPEMIALKVCDDLPRWDDDATMVIQEESLADVIWDDGCGSYSSKDEVGPFLEFSEEVIWDEETMHELHAFEQIVLAKPARVMNFRESAISNSDHSVLQTQVVRTSAPQEVIWDNECKQYFQSPNGSLKQHLDILEFDLGPPADVIWDQEDEDRVSAKRKQMSIQVVWDVEFQHDYDSPDRLLQQLADGEFSDDVKSNEVAELTKENILAQDIVWDEVMSTDTMHEGLLQHLALGGDYLGQEQSNSNLHFGLLQQLALGEEFLDCGKTNQNVEVDADEILTHLDGDMLSQEIHLFELVVVKHAAEHGDEMSNQMSKPIIELKDCAVSLEVNAELFVMIRPWDPGISMATAWGQAVFRGAGNVMTRRWAETSTITKGQPSPIAKVKATKEGAVHIVRSRTEIESESGSGVSPFLVGDDDLTSRRSSSAATGASLPSSWWSSENKRHNIPV